MGSFIRSILRRSVAVSFLTGAAVMISAGQEEWPFGNSYVENIGATVYGGDIQIWAVEPGEEDYVFFATATGLSVWDGVRWSFYRTETESYLRCLCYDPVSHTLYSAGNNEFGRWRRNRYGDFEYERLYLNRDVSMGKIFWRCAVQGEEVYFQTHETVYCWNGRSGETVTLEPGAYLNYMHICGDRLYVQADEVFYLLDSMQLKPAGFSFPDRVVKLVENNGDFWLFSEGKGIWRWKEGRLQEVNAETNAVLSVEKVFSVAEYGEKGFIVGSVLDGMYLLDTKGKVVSVINGGNGLQNTTVLSAAVDRKGDIWLGLDGGIARVYRDFKEKYYQSFSGKIGSVYAVEYNAGKLWLGTNKGLFCLRPSGDLHFIAGSQGQVWDIYTAGEDLIVSHDKGMFRVEEGRFVRLPFPGSWVLKPFPQEPGLYYSVDFTGLTIYELKGGRLHYRNRLENYNGSNNNAYVDKYGYIWLQGNDGGAVRLKTDRDRRRAEEVRTYDIPHRIGTLPGFCQLDNEVIFYSDGEARLYDITADSLVQHAYYSGLLKLCGEDPVSLTQVGNRFFYVTRTQTGLIERQNGKFSNRGSILGNARDRMIPQAFRRFFRVTESFMALGLQNGVAFYNLKAVEKERNMPRLQLRKVRVTGRDGTVLLGLEGDRIVIPAGTTETDLFFTGLSPFRSLDYRIDGGEWNTVIAEDALTLPYMEPGEHMLQVRDAAYGEQAPVYSQQLDVERPWFLSEKSILAVFLLLVGGLLLGNQWYIRRLERRHRRQERLREEEMNKQRGAYEVEMMRRELKEKDKKLINYTMEGINRNNMLSEIREEVLQLRKNLSDPESKIKNIVRKIDSHLNDKENWKVFEKYFNTIYDGFFDRLMKRYPNLTTNELKICAYIRLNLTSKEISVLLNISPSSVEMARHRLRKKLGIASDTSLFALMADI